MARLQATGLHGVEGGDTTWFGGPPTSLDNTDARRVTIVRGNVRKGVGRQRRLKVRTNPRRKPAVGMRAATRGPRETRVARGNARRRGLGVNEAELAMRDAPKVKLRCQNRNHQTP